LSQLLLPPQLVEVLLWLLLQVLAASILQQEQHATAVWQRVPG
jgi:hypothetical protein